MKEGGKKMKFSTKWDGISGGNFTIIPESEIGEIFLEDVVIPNTFRKSQGEKVLRRAFEASSLQEMDKKFDRFTREVKEIHSQWIKQTGAEDAREMTHVVLYRALYGWDNAFDDARLEDLQKKLKEQPEPDNGDEYLEKVYQMAKRILEKAFDFSGPDKLAEDKKSLEDTEGFLGCTDDLFPWQMYSVRNMALKLWHQEEDLKKSEGVHKFLIEITERFPRKNELIK